MDAEADCKAAGISPELLDRIRTLPPWSTDFTAAENVVLGAIDARRQLRPYRDIIAYRAPGKHRPERRKGHGRKPIWTRALNFLTIGQATTQTLVYIFETIGILPPRPSCRFCPDGGNVDVRVRTTSQRIHMSLRRGSSRALHGVVRRCTRCLWEASLHGAHRLACRHLGHHLFSPPECNSFVPVLPAV